MKMTNPEMKVIRFAAEDVIATSMYIMKASDYYGNSMLDGYVSFEGEMFYYDSEEKAYVVNSHGANPIDEETIESWKDYAYSGVYDAYSENGYFYTKGASYFDLYNEQ